MSDPQHTRPAEAQHTRPAEEAVPEQKKKGFFGKALYKIKKFWQESRRVFKVTKKPGKDEFMMIVKVTGLGILAIGAIGFILYLLKELLL